MDTFLTEFLLYKAKKNNVDNAITSTLLTDEIFEKRS
jgi:hypothetical protein